MNAWKPWPNSPPNICVVIFPQSLSPPISLTGRDMGEGEISGLERMLFWKLPGNREGTCGTALVGDGCHQCLLVSLPTGSGNDIQSNNSISVILWHLSAVMDLAWVSCCHKVDACKLTGVNSVLPSLPVPASEDTDVGDNKGDDDVSDNNCYDKKGCF